MIYIIYFLAAIITAGFGLAYVKTNAGKGYDATSMVESLDWKNDWWAAGIVILILSVFWFISVPVFFIYKWGMKIFKK